LGLVAGTELQKKILRVIVLEQLKTFDSLPYGKACPGLIEFAQSKTFLSSISALTF